MKRTTCSIKDCENTGKIIKSWCNTHYRRYQKYGDPSISKKIGPYNLSDKESCSISDCENKSRAMGWCVKHYWNWYYRGDLLFITKERRPYNMTDKELLAWMTSAPQLKKKLNGCWEWHGNKNKQNYGHTKYKGKVILVHRLMWFLTWGYMPVKLILHSCDNPSCFNPDHLSEGTQQDNMDDMVKRGRQAKGEKSGSAKLTEQQVIAIKKFYKTGKHTQTKLGEMFNTPQGTISRICSGKHWKYV